jgi:outer membrane lipase/esterase
MLMNFSLSRLAAALASATALSMSASAQAQYSGIITFGDSLSDGGTYGAKFLNNPGSVWIEILAARMGLKLTPWTQGGTNFAQGGQRVSQSPGITPTGAPERPVSAQITQYLTASGGTVAAGSLVTMWAGANDIFVNLEAASKGLISSADVQANIQKAATDFVGQVARLQKAGAGTIIVVNLPDIGTTPLGLNAGANQGTFTALSGLFNTIVNTGLGQIGGNVISINASGVLAEVIKNPSSFGFTNVTVPLCKTASSITCTPADLRDPNGGKTWLFADSVHPTTGAHEVLANVVGATMAAPIQMSVLPEASLTGVRAQSRVLDARQRASLNGGNLGVFANIDIGKNSLRGVSDMDTTSITVGLDRKFGVFTLGGAIGVHETKGDLLGGGDFKLSQPMITMFGATNLGAAYVGANAFASDARYRDINRNITIGTATRVENSSTVGSLLGVGVNGGLWMKAGGWQHGPFAKVEYSNLALKGFAEPGTSATALQFSKQRREQLLATLGYQVSASLGQGGLTYSPYLRAAYEHDFNADAKMIGVRTVSMAGSQFASAGIAPNESQVLVEAGVNVRWNTLDIGLGITGGTNRDSGSYSAVNLGLRVPL